MPIEDPLNENRSPLVVFRVSEKLSQASSRITENNIRGWFSKIVEYLIKNNNEDILLDPRRIFNSNETGIELNPEKSKVLTRKGAKNVFQVEDAAAKVTVTALYTVSSDGKMVPPLLVFKPTDSAEYGIGTNISGL